MGHYTGLVHLGREAYAASEMPVHGSARMCELLATNQPWRLLVDLEHIALRPFTPGEPVALGDALRVTPIEVPHRAELTDTFGFLVRGPRRSLLYIPDIDKWERWETRVEDRIAEVDVALLDGTFFADGEIPGRSMADIPHPFIQESIARFSPLPASERAKIIFTHLNHTNPAAQRDSAAAARVREAGMRIAEDGEIFEL
jgi:pyrroloquinoline quinone biosynthesis protein B